MELFLTFRIQKQKILWPVTESKSYLFYKRKKQHKSKFTDYLKVKILMKRALVNFDINNLLTGLLGPYWEIRSPIFFVGPELARAVRKSEGLVFLVRTE